MQSNINHVELPKMRIATTITETKSVEKDIELPYYFKDYLRRLCKIVSKDHLISVDTEKSFWSVSISPTDACKDRIAQGIQITEDEFDAAYQKATMYVDLIYKNHEPSNENDENEEIDQMRDRQTA